MRIIRIDENSIHDKTKCVNIDCSTPLEKPSKLTAGLSDGRVIQAYLCTECLKAITKQMDQVGLNPERN